MKKNINHDLIAYFDKHGVVVRILNNAARTFGENGVNMKKFLVRTKAGDTIFYQVGEIYIDNYLYRIVVVDDKQSIIRYCAFWPRETKIEILDITDLTFDKVL